MIHVTWLSFIEDERPEDKWDSTLVKELTAGLQFEHHYGAREIANHGDASGDGGIVVFPGGIHADPEHVQQLQDELHNLDWAILIVTADEQTLFPHENLNHRNMHVWLQTPRGLSADENFGYCNPAAHRGVKTDRVEKDLDWFFAGQATNERRRQMMETVDWSRMPSGCRLESGGFTEGLSAEEYYAQMARAKVVPCPAGPTTIDTFRSWEAIEHGAFPLLDDQCGHYTDAEVGYWGNVMPGAPVRTINNWAQLPEAVEQETRAWPGNANRLWSWWQLRKCQLKTDLLKTVEVLSGQTEPTVSDVTVLISSSPSPTHPSTEMLERVITSVRAYLPDSEILVMLDGVAPMLESHSDDYEMYIHRVLWLCEHELSGVVPVILPSHGHQTGSVTRTLPLVQTPYLMLLEHDFELFGDIPVTDLLGLIREGEADVVRINMETAVEPAHLHMHIDKEPITVCGVPLQRTWQWSSRPHFASTAYYKQLADNHFRVTRPEYVESVMSSVCSVGWVNHGMNGWFRDRIVLYTPPGDQQRCRHLDGRSGDPSYMVIY